MLFCAKMNDTDSKQGLPARKEQIRRQLDKHPSTKANVMSRIGKLIRPSIIEGHDQKKFRFGLALLAIAIFILVLVLVLPNDNRRWYFVCFGVATLFAGAWVIDKSNCKQEFEKDVI